MISTNQSAFIRGRCIHDNFIIVQQTIKLLHCQKVPNLFLKLDISKAFDSVSWAFLLEVLNHLGFGNTWCNLVSNLLTMSTTRVLLNGEPGATIKHQCGLMLFIIVIYVLNNLFVKASEVGLLQPLSIQMAGQRLSLYADDVVQFIKPLEEELNATMTILDAFGQALGLQTNLNKSFIILIQCVEDSVEEISNTMPCTMAEFPCTYLGLPISNKKLRKADLTPWIKKIADKVPG
jgi:hypothetical protein